MNPRKAFFACLERSPPALFEAALWIAAEHDPAVQPSQTLQELTLLQQQVSQGMPLLPADELGQPLLRRLNDLGFAQDEFTFAPRRRPAGQSLAAQTWATPGYGPDRP